MKLLLRAALFLALALPAAAQKASMWKHLQRPDYGGSLRFLSITEGDSSEAIDLTGIGVIGGFNLPFLELDDDMSIGINPNLYGGYYLSMELPSMSFEIPAYITWKWGTDATWAGSKSWIGTTLGLGYDYNIFIAGGDALGVVTYGVPSLMAEVNFGKRRGGVGLIKLRYSMGIGSADAVWEDGLDDYTLTMRQYAFDLIVTTGY